MRAREEFKHLIEVHELRDTFRKSSPGKKTYTWRKYNPDLKQARLDYIFVSADILCNVQRADIVSGYRTDHSAVRIDLVVNQHERGKGWFKFNTSLLKDDEYLSIMREAVYNTLELYALPVYTREFLIEDLGQTAQFTVSLSLLWVALILQLRTQTISYSISQTRNKAKTEEKIVCAIQRLEEEIDQNPRDTSKLQLHLFAIGFGQCSITIRRRFRQFVIEQNPSLTLAGTGGGGG